MFQPIYVAVQANASADELFAEWLRLSTVQEQADAFVADQRAKLRDAVSGTERKALSDLLETSWQHYQVLCAYIQAVYSAYIFSTYGGESFYLTDTVYQAGYQSNFPE